ncbi:MAG: hypothetical protein WCE62_22020 [Polyangiales bacterium]
MLSEVRHCSVVTGEADEASILHPVTFGRARPERGHLGELRVWRERALVVRGCEPVDRSGRVRGFGSGTLLLVDLVDHVFELREREPLRQCVQDGGGDLVVRAVLTCRLGASIWTWPSPSMTP